MKVLQIGNTNDSFKLDKKDKQILELLCKNVRHSSTTISRAIKLSRQTTEYRMDMLQKNQIITGAISVINTKKLNLYSYHFFITLNDSTAEKELIERCKKEQSCNAFISYMGKYNCEISIMEKSPELAKSKIKNLIQGLPIRFLEETALTKTIVSQVLPSEYREKINLPANTQDRGSFSQAFEKNIYYSPDNIDYRIIGILAKNAKVKMTELAVKIGLSDDGVIHRVKKLIEAGFILQFRPIINFSKFKLSVSMILLRVSENEKELEKYLKEENSIIWAAKAFGRWDYILYVLTNNNESLINVMDNIKNTLQTSLIESETLMGKEEYKYQFITDDIILKE
jgi:DNA-binding Lrp family transcriptional regulator